MPKYPYRDLGINFDRNFRNALNANFDDIEADIKELGAGAQQALEAAHEAETQAIYARTSGDYAQDKGDYAAQQGDFAQTQGNYAKSQGDYAKTQGQYAQQVANENKTRWLNPVANFPAIATNYPNPQHGDTVMTLEDGKIYRYENGQWKFTQQYNSTALNNLANELSKQNQQSVTIGHGLNIINASQNSPLDIQIEGRTLVNLLGTDGNCEDVSKFYTGGNVSISTDTSTKKYGDKSIKLQINTGGTYGLLKKDVPVISGKYYLVGVSLRNQNADRLYLKLNGDMAFKSSEVINSDFKDVFVKLSNSSSNLLIEVVIEGSQGTIGYVDGFRLYEITAEEYNNIGTVWNDEEVARRYPYVDSVQHVQNPYVIAEGENLLPPFTEWTNLHPNTEILSPYELQINANGQWQGAYIDLNLVPNQTYTVDVEINGNDVYYWIKSIDSNGNLSDLLTFRKGLTTFTVPNGIKKIRFECTNATAGTFTFTNPMLTVGSQPKPFMPRNPSYLFAEVKLGSLADKKDILFKENGDWKKLKWIEDVVLDGSWQWVFSSDYSGYKRVYADATQYEPVVDTKREIVVKHSGKILKTISATSAGQTSGDQAFISDDGQRSVYITIFDTDSGWGEDYTPTTAEIQAYFYGWRMCNGTYGQPYDGTGTKTWYPIGDTDLSRAVTTCPTSAAPTIAEGKIGYYKLSYILATPQTIVVTDKVEGDLVVNGATQVEVGSGFTYTEVDGKRTYTKLAANQRYNVTANILSVIANYDTSLKSVVDSMVAKQSDIAATVSVNVRAIAELYKRVKALGG
ncbi:hypothetical protein [Geobacillus stearothermophilus]|uniref:Uncharacterized protein n=1 Tax=Geobacillus stearothermophilus TaxID=1422 RepID=A0A150MQ88_GEOSE|nr:hypothetical protein [Geobacillus stearothermophilus]KYD26542.1 hypothetical protein B4109_3161 [Geobacillus stearothermophilus]